MTHFKPRETADKRQPLDIDEIIKEREEGLNLKTSMEKLFSQAQEKKYVQRNIETIPKFGLGLGGYRGPIVQPPQRCRPISSTREATAQQ